MYKTIDLKQKDFVTYDLSDCNETWLVVSYCAYALEGF